MGGEWGSGQDWRFASSGSPLQGLAAEAHPLLHGRMQPGFFRVNLSGVGVLPFPDSVVAFIGFPGFRRSRDQFINTRSASSKTFITHHAVSGVWVNGTRR